MKKAFTLFMILALCFSLASCDPGSFEYDYDVMMETVTSVELITYDNPDVKTVSYFLGDDAKYLKDFDFEKMTVVESLPDEELDAFMTALCEKSYFIHWTFLNSPANGYNLKITYSDESFDIIALSEDFGCHYDKDGKVIDHVANGLFNANCEAFFETEFE